MDPLHHKPEEDVLMSYIFRFLYDYTYFMEGTTVSGHFSEYRTNMGWTFLRSGKEIQVQKDSYNCGIFALMFARAVIMNQNPTAI